MKSLLIKFTKASFLFAFIFVCLFMFLVSFNNSYDNNGLVANAVETKMNFHSDSAWTDGSGGNIARKYVADIDLAQGIVPIESNTDDTQTYKKTKSLDDSDIGISIPTFDALSLRNSLWNVLKDAPSNWTETFGYDWHMDPLSERTDNGLPSGTSPNKNNGGWATVSKYAIRDKRIESNDSTAVLQKGVAARGTNIKQYIQYQFNVSFSDPIIQAAISTNRFKVSLSYSVQFNVISVNETVSGPFGNVEVKHSNDGSGNTFVSSGSFTNTVKASSETSRNASGVAPHASINNNSITFAVEISSVVAGGTHLKGMYFDAIKFTDLKLNFEYTTAKSEFKVDGDNGSGIIDVNGTKTNSNNNTITQYPDLLGQMSEGEKRLTATVTQSANYVFLGWFKNSVLVTHSLTLTTPQPYTFTGDALYTARIKKIMSNDGVSGIVDNQNYTYNQITHGVGSKQGPTGFVNFTTYFDSGGGVYSQIVLLHSYVSSDGGKHNPAQVEINSDDNKTPSNQPKDVGKYRYTVTAVHKTTKNGANSYDSVNVGQLSVEFSIIKYAPDPDLGYAINIPFLNYGINLSQLAIEGSNPVINGVEIDGSYQIDYTGVGYSAASVPTATINAVKVKFVPDDTTNIASITLSGTYTIIFRKAEILFGYFDDKNEFQSGIPTKPGTLTYGQKNEIFMDYVKSTMRLKNPQENVYVDYEVTTNMPLYPVATDEDKTASTTVTFDITKTKIYLKTHYGMTGDIPATDLYTIAVAEKTFQYKVFRANLVFTKIDEFELKFPDNKTTAGNDNVFNMATITYGHTINYARVAAADDIIYAIASDASTTQIKYTWYRTNTAGEKGAIISETEYLSVADSTDTSGSGKNYYIITANVLNNNSSENKNYNEYRFYGQKLVIYKAKISPTIKLEADPIKYGIDVKEALSKVVKDDDGINSVNNTMKVYYTFTWNEAASTKNITQALNYPYLNVPEIETTYAVQITIYKANNNGTLAVDNKSEGIIDDINYESNGIFTFDANNELIFAKLTINRIEQDFYVKVGGVALPMSLINLTEALINDNDNVNKEEKVNFKINATENDTSDNDIEVETSYSAQKSTFFVINIYSTGVVKTGLNSNPNALNRTLKPIFEKFYLGNPFSISVNTNSVEKIGEDWYTKFTIRVDINPYVATTAQIAKFSFSQMESEENNGNVIGGNYNAKSWDGETTNAYNPFTIYLKIYKDAPGLSSDKLKNPDNVYDKNTYQYLIFYGDELSIGVTGVVSIKEGDSRKYISLAVDNNVKKLKGIREGVAELNYIEEGNVVPSDLGGAYVEINIDFCVLIRKKAASITVTISHNSFVYGDKFKIKNTTVEPNFTPSGDFIDGDLQNASIVYSIFVTNQPTPDEFSTDSVYGAGSYNLGVYEITNFVILEYGAEEERFNKLDNYKISFAICQIEINKKDVNMQIVEVTNSYNKSEILNTGTVTYMTYRIPYSDAYQIEDIKWIKFAISYDGFVGADTIDSLIAADKYPSIYIASTDSEGVNIVPAGRSPNVGTYKLYKHEYVDAELENYNLIFQDGLHSFIVDPVSVDLRFLIDNEGNEMENSIVSNFNDTAQDFKNYFRLYGVTESAPTPRGTIKINYSKVEGVWLSSVKAAGTYDVKIEYTVATGIDNYMATEKIYSESVIILAIDPTIVIPSYSNVYTGSAINYVVTVEGVGSDIPALKDITVTYSQNGKEYVSDKPMKAGSYYVKVVYAPPVDANYCPIDATTQTAVINITKANVSITNEESLNTQYSANYLLSSQFKIIATGVGEDLEKGAFSSSYLKYEFRRPTEDNWVLWVDNKNTPIDVGSYEVKVTYLSSLNSEISDNYLETEKIFRNNALVIMPKMLESISLSSTFKKIEGVYDGERKEIKVNDTNIKITTGISQSNDTIIPSIPNIDNIVVSYARVSFTIDVNGMKNYAIGAYSINAPINVGSYVLKFTYNANSGENYAYYPGIDIDLENTTEQELLDAVVITITLATPTITLKNTKLPYNAKAQPITAYSAVGVKNEKPVGSYSITYQNANTTGGVWSEKAPMEIGEYNVKVSFYALTGGNYSNAEEVFVGRFAIIKGNLSVILTDRTYNFTGRSIEKANPTVIVPGGASIDMELVTIKYRVHNATEWIAPGVLPYASGYYDVFIFVQETDIYVEYSKIFENSIRVLNIAPNFTVQKYTKIYNAVALDFPSSNITLINSSAGNTQADQAMGATNELTGYFLFRYTVDGAVWTENTPLNSGVYSIRIIYFEGINDNFSTIETIAFNAVYEITPRILEVVPIAGSKVYDKKTIDGSSIEFGFSSQESSPLDDIVPTGSLYAGSAVTTGNYAIELGTLSYGYNYVLTKTATIVYYSILKKEVLPIFETAEYVYDGTPKAPKVSPSSGDILSSDTPNDVRMEVTYATDTISSGTFRAYASIDPVSNYKIADGAVAYKEYVIEKATMTGNLFGESLTSDKLGRETVAKYNSSFHDMVLIKVEPGASVVYSPRQTAYVEIGSYEITATVTKPNYKDEVITATLRIIKGEHTIDIKVAERVLYFADPLPRLITSAPGIVSLDITQSLLPEISEYRWTFTPDDSTHFVEQKGVIELKVERALPKAIVNGNLDRTSNDTSAILVDVAVGNQIIQTISNVFFADASGTRYSQVPTTPGVYTLVVEIAGNDLVSDNTCTYIITVNKERNVTWFYYVIGAAFAILVVAIIIVSKRNKMVIR